jgi:hypothetical protein
VINLSKILKFSTLILLILLTFTMIAVASVNAQEVIPPEQYPTVPNPNTPPTPAPSPQEVAKVVVAASVGGTTNPEAGAYQYNYGDTITLEATASTGYKFLYWTISGSYTPGHNIPPVNYPQNAATDPNWAPVFPPASEVAQNSLVTSTNPLQIICGYGYTFVYQPVFAPTTAAPASSDAIVEVLNSIGGTTNPGPGTYYYANGTTINLQATPDSGNTFVYWVATGTDGHPTTISDNPTNIDCGYGYTYSYQAMFAPAGTETSSGGMTNVYLYVVIVVLAVIAAIGVAAALVYRSRRK